MKRTHLAAAISLWAIQVGTYSSKARADAQPGDPFAYNLRIALSPLAFQAALSQSWFGSAARIEYGPWRFLDVAVDGRIGWFAANRSEELAHSYLVRVGLSFHLAQTVSERQLYGTVYPADTPSLTANSPGTDRDLIDLPVHERLRTGLGAPHDRDLTLTAAMRVAHSLRVGAAYVRLLERAQPEDDAVARNELPCWHLGYSYATHWNLASDVTGKREIGYRRFYGDVLLTSTELIRSNRERTSQGQRVGSEAFGARIGMQGAIEGLSRAAPSHGTCCAASLGFAYDLEIGMYPGRSGLEGFLFLALGVALDAVAQ